METKNKQANSVAKKSHIKNKMIALILTSLFLMPCHAASQENRGVAQKQEGHETPTLLPGIRPIIWGKNSAAIKVVEYSSINCRHCSSFHSEAFKQRLREKFIEPGTVQMLFKHFPLDYTAVEYFSLIVNEPYEQWGDLLDRAFARQADWFGHPPEKLAGILGISSEKCKEARACEEKKDLIMAIRFNAEQTIDIEATPSFHIFWKEKGEQKSLLINQGILPDKLIEQLDAIALLADEGDGW